MQIVEHVDGLPWRAMTVDAMVHNVVEAFRKWPWSQYDGVPDANPNQVTILDLAVANVMGASISLGVRKDDWGGLGGHRAVMEEFLRRCAPSVALWDVDQGATALLDAFVGLINSLEWVTGWKSGKLTAVLHRKRPNFIPILDNVVVDGLVPQEGTARREDRLDRACAALAAFRQEMIEHRGKLDEVVKGVARRRPDLGRLTLVRAADVLIRVQEGNRVSPSWEGATWR